MKKTKAQMAARLALMMGSITDFGMLGMEQRYRRGETSGQRYPAGSAGAYRKMEAAEAKRERRRQRNRRVNAPVDTPPKAP